MSYYGVGSYKNIWKKVLEFIPEVLWYRLKINTRFRDLIKECTCDYDVEILARNGQIESLKQYGKYKNVKFVDICYSNILCIKRYVYDMGVGDITQNDLNDIIKHHIDPICIYSLYKQILNNEDIGGIVTYIIRLTSNKISDFKKEESRIINIFQNSIGIIKKGNLKLMLILYNYSISVKHFIDEFPRLKNTFKNKTLEFMQEYPIFEHYHKILFL